MLMCTLDPQTAASSGTGTQMRQLVKMTYGVVIGLLVFNVPGFFYAAVVPYETDSNIAV